MTDCAVRAEIADELPHLRRYALSLARDAALAEDLVQDTALRAIERADGYAPDTHLRRWLFTILRNASIDRGRKAARRGPQLELDEAGEGALARPPAQEDSLALDEVRRRIEWLAPGERRIIRMSVVEGLAHAEIAERTGVAVGTVKSRLSRVRAKLAA